MKRNLKQLSLRLVLTLTLALGCVCGLAACAESEAPGESQQTQATMTVQVDVTAPDSAGNLFSGSLELPEGATALDALEATGVDYVAEDSQYGKFVSSIGGVANGETSATAGWTYSLNGQMAMESCDALVLSNGDSLTWEYSEFE